MPLVTGRRQGLGSNACRPLGSVGPVGYSHFAFGKLTGLQAIVLVGQEDKPLSERLLETS